MASKQQISDALYILNGNTNPSYGDESSYYIYKDGDKTNLVKFEDVKKIIIFSMDEGKSHTMDRMLGFIEGYNDCVDKKPTSFSDKGKALINTLIEYGLKYTPSEDEAKEFEQLKKMIR